MVSDLLNRYQNVRRFSNELCQPLAVEDYVVQSMPDASPARWHLAHTTWFFETFVLARWEPAYRPANQDYQFLFNSYYNQVGEQFPRGRRGLLTRPTVAEVFAYRQAVDQRVEHLLGQLDDNDLADCHRIIDLGINHEQQHQELLLTDLKHLFSCNPLWPVYCHESRREAASGDQPSGWSRFEGGVVEIGHAGKTFAFDNESPRHRVYLNPFAIQERLVTNAEYLVFMQDGGYRRPELWLSLGWSTLREQRWTTPLYWVEREDAWHEFTLGGLGPLNPAEPVCHVSYFEADAFARWSGARLPTEAEWEHATAGAELRGSFAEGKHYHPSAENGGETGLRQMFGELWQWTASPYTPYPGYQAPPGALGEYNGKFMCNQYVLRGGSCATPASHLRVTYRNFFPPETRWQFTGIRLARDAS